MKQILLHVCCAPCSTHVIKELKELEYEVILFFYNPNIHPEEEYQKRLENAKIIAKELNLKLIEGPYDQENWHKQTIELKNEPEGGKRCEICFKIRLEKTAETAKENQIQNFTTTLSVSPYKDFKIIEKVGKEIEDETNVKFINLNFKKQNGYRKSLELSKKHDLYRQHYCGCIYSQK
ncbi:epoxyqueuosine reductase QueH [Nanoarchaeota archaeon]